MEVSWGGRATNWCESFSGGMCLASGQLKVTAKKRLFTNGLLIPIAGLTARSPDPRLKVSSKKVCSADRGAWSVWPSATPAENPLENGVGGFVPFSS